jgi:hypothetical protein
MIDVQSRVDGFGFYGALPASVCHALAAPKLVREGLLADRRRAAARRVALYITSYGAYQ